MACASVFIVPSSALASGALDVIGVLLGLAVESFIGGVVVDGVVTDGVVTDGLVGDVGVESGFVVGVIAESGFVVGVVGDGVVVDGMVDDGVLGDGLVDGLVVAESRAGRREVSPGLELVVRGGASFVTRVPERVVSFVLLGVGFCASAGAAASARASHAAPAVEVQVRMRPPHNETVTRP